MEKPYGREVNGIFLEKETADSFEKMKETALKDGIEIIAVSGYRSFERQREIWNKKVEEFLKKANEEKAVRLVLRYSAFPGTSRHGWGTDIDITGKEKIPNPLENKNYREGGIYYDIYKWLKKNAGKFGFYQVYVVNSELREIEEWHWSYAPRAREFLKCFLEMVNASFLKGRDIKLSNYVLNSFEEYIKNYMLKINSYLYQPIPSTR
jgi:LAS superfamily LD-carboxypeptidase LdcB